MRKKVPAPDSLFNPDEVLNEKQTAALVKLTPRQLRELRYDGDGPPFCKINRQVLYRRSSVFHWLASIESKPRAAAWKVKEREDRRRAAAEAASAAPAVQP